MTIATKNGVPIVKDGVIASNCGCCGWYCSAPQCPCKYAKALPQSLTATLAFTLSENMYGMSLGNFTGAFLSTWRVTPQQASQASGVYALSRPSPSGSPCFYRYQSGGVRIEVTVGASSGAFNFESLNAGCSASQTSLHLSYLGFGVQATRPLEFWSSFINNICPGHPSFVNNAASRTYSGGNFTVACPDTVQPANAIGWGTLCNWQPPFPLYNNSFRLDGAPGGRDTPACSNINLTEINHSWAFDVVYTDTSGPFPVVGRIPRAVTLNISE